MLDNDRPANGNGHGIATRGGGHAIGATEAIDIGPRPTKSAGYLPVARLLITLYHVEPAVAALAALQATNEQLSTLNRCLASLRKVAKARDLGRFMEGEKRFHSLIGAMSGDDVLAGMVETSRCLVERAVSQEVVVFPTDLSTCVIAHEKVAEAIGRRDARAAREAMEKDVERLLGYNVDLVREVCLAPAPA